MKKSLIVPLAAALLATASAWAGFGLPSTGSGLADKAVNMGKNKAVEQVINDKLNKHNCAFKNDKTTSDTTCNIDKVISDLTSWKNGLEGTIVSKVSVNVNASAANGDASIASTRAQEIRNRLYQQMSWWDYNVNSSTSNGNKLGLSVSVR